MAGNICHFEIAVTDLAAAQAFYGELFGWTYMMAGEEYAVIHVEGGVGGGLTLRKECPPDGPILLYIHVDDIPTMLERIRRAGGKIEQEKTAIGGEWGFMAVFRDPSGNLMGLWAAK